MTLTAPDVLLKAASLIEARWCQGSYRSENGGVCAITAISDATEMLGLSSWTMIEAAGLLCDKLSIVSIPAWNDSPGRTSDEVAAAMRWAAQ